MIFNETLIFLLFLFIIHWVYLYFKSYIKHIFYKKRKYYRYKIRHLTYRYPHQYIKNKKTEYIYFVYIPNGKVKIGLSTNLTKRLKTHRTTLGKIKVLGIIPVKNSLLAESFVHRKFYNYAGEVYWLTPKLILFIILLRNEWLTNTYQKVVDIQQ